MNKYKKVLVGATLAVASVVPMATSVDAAQVGISGATSWSAPCNFYTSSNARVATGNTIKVALTSVGTLGVKFRVLFTASGAVTGAQYWSGAESTAKTMTTSANQREFRNQFSCVNGRANGTSPSTDFAGTLTY